MNTHPTPIQPRLPHYDVVIVGARAAGAATAMLLAKEGLRVLAVDRQAYGSDTLSTHALMRGAVNRLAHWGLLDVLWRQGNPVITSTQFQYGDESLSLDVRPSVGVPGLVAPRRTVLDPILVNAALAHGAEVLHETRVKELVRSASGRVEGVHLALRDGSNVVIEADLVIGADGLRSPVARAVGAPITHQGEHASAYTMRYYSNFDTDRNAYRWLYRQALGSGIIPTSDGVTCVFTAMPPAIFKTEGRRDVEGIHRHNANRLDPALASAIDEATPVGPMRSFPGVPGQFRKPHGPGWALVGDAGYFKDPFAAHGITDAFRDAELLTGAVLTGDFAGYEAHRDELSMPLFEVLDRIASHGWDLEELKHLHLRLSKAMKAEDLATAPQRQPSIAA
jgi:2-polyprenyl-6-methoxyphenol hydroxylase-like FAD-dependent oxidoreductase